MSVIIKEGNFCCCSYSFPPGAGLLKKWERSSELSLSAHPIAECYNPFLLEIICNCVVCRYHSVLWDVCMEGIYFLSYVISYCFSCIKYILNADGMASKGRNGMTWSSWSGFFRFKSFGHYLIESQVWPLMVQTRLDISSLH